MGPIGILETLEHSPQKHFLSVGCWFKRSSSSSTWKNRMVLSRVLGEENTISVTY